MNTSLDSLVKKSAKELKELLADKSIDSDAKELATKILKSRGEIETGAEDKLSEIKSHRSPKELSSVKALRAIAWAYFFISVSAGLYVAIAHGSSQVPGYSMLKKYHPDMIAIGIGSILQGILLCSLCLVFCSIADSLRSIQNTLIENKHC